MSDIDLGNFVLISNLKCSSHIHGCHVDMICDVGQLVGYQAPIDNNELFEIQVSGHRMFIHT